MKRSCSLRAHMFRQYAAIVLICMIVIPAGIAKILDIQMRNFLDTRLLEDEQRVVGFIQDLYNGGGTWDISRFSQLHSDLLRRPLMSATLTDSAGRVVWEFRRTGMREFMRNDDRPRGMGNGHHGAMSLPNLSQQHYVTREGRVMVGGQVVGVVKFVYMPFVETREAAFLQQFHRHMFFAVALMLVVASLFSFVMADRISKPVLKLANRAALIGRGKYDTNGEMDSNIRELQILIHSMDRLGMSLEAQEELRRRLLGDVAHELRSPITIVKSHLEAFEDGVWSPTPERIKLTVGEIDRLSSLIAEIERLSSLESGDEQLNYSLVNISEELEREAATLEPMYRDKSLSLQLNIEPDVVAAVDIAKLRRAVENLLQNALRYTDCGGEVTLSLKATGKTAEISVSDSGIGINEKDLPYIFERFYRTDTSRTRESGGMGIGLAIAKAIVEAHLGEITVESKEGEGSRFIITLPIRTLEEVNS